MSAGSIELMELARSVALQAGELVAARRAAGIEVAATKSSAEDVVTLADRESEALIRQLLADARPSDAFHGEESGSGSGSSGITWVVDPIDGTVNYLYGIPYYSVSIAAIEGEPTFTGMRPVAGAVHSPGLGTTYTAALGEGAWRDGRSIVTPPAPPTNLALLTTGFAYTQERRQMQAAMVGELITKVRDIRRFGSAAIDICNVAEGQVNAYTEGGINPWDAAAGIIVATEAGASVQHLQLGDPSLHWLLVAPSPLDAALRDLLLEAADSITNR